MNSKIKLSEDVYRDKVYGCWLGKNAGGTLGEPLEERYGKEEMFDVSWYPELPEEGLPNDDLEMQLIWLQALQERGPGITARDMAEYWQDCIVYNFDEYGLNKTNLKKGLMPPVSGWFNNWFIDCMGSPIRSEIWACVAPAAPAIAARYAFEDAVVDHAGGESVYGEIFNAVVESCAFVIEDKFKLIEIGLSSIPEDCETYNAIKDTVALHEEGVSWTEAREKIKNKYYSPIAQYSPINLAFQTIGWLYGEDFGDAICKAVNCGWDTDCTGATLGAILGIIEGAENLPQKWLEPLGDEISTNVRNGGIKNLIAPTDVYELTDQVCTMGSRVLKYWDTDVEIITGAVARKEIDFKFSQALSVNYNPRELNFDLDTLQAALEYEEEPAITGDKPVPVRVKLENPHPEALQVNLSLELPEKWEVKPDIPLTMDIGAKSDVTIRFEITAPATAIEESNLGIIKIQADERPALLSVPLVLVGGSSWVVSPVVDESSETMEMVKETKLMAGMPVNWDKVWRSSYDLEPEKLFNDKNGVIYLANQIKSDEEKKVVLGVPTSNRMKLWLNGEFLHETDKKVPFRPNQGHGGGDGSNYVHTTLKKGWNQVLIRLEREEEPLEAHFTIGGIDEKHPINNGFGVTGLERSQFIWEIEE